MAGLVQKFKDMWTPPENDYEYEYDDIADEIDDEQMEDSYYDNEPRDRKHSSNYNNVREQENPKNNKVVNIHATTQLQVVLVKPEQFGEETRSVADELLKMHTVLLNLESTSKENARRILDFLSGVAYANNGKIKRVATSTFIITPYNVDLTGEDLMGELESNGVSF